MAARRFGWAAEFVILASCTALVLKALPEFGVAASIGLVSAVALAWVQSRPGVTSTIIGARRLDQLDQNLAALDVTLKPEHKAALDRISEPSLNFPTPFLRMATSIMHAGATVNGESSELLPLWKEAAEKRY